MKSINIKWSTFELTISTESDKDFEGIVRESINNALLDAVRIGVVIDHIRGVLRDIALLDSYLIEVNGCYFGYKMPVTLLPIKGTNFDIYVKDTFSAFIKESGDLKYFIYHTWLDEHFIGNIDFENLVEYYRDGKCIDTLTEFYGITEIHDVYLTIKNGDELIGNPFMHKYNDDETHRFHEMASSDFIIYESTFSEGKITPEDIGLASGIQVPIVRKVDGRNRIIRAMDFTGPIVKYEVYRDTKNPIKNRISEGYSFYITNNYNWIKLLDPYLGILVD